MDDALDIREVVRKTGLTSRALRFYEARGLVAPVRTSRPSPLPALRAASDG